MFEQGRIGQSKARDISAQFILLMCAMAADPAIATDSIYHWGASTDIPVRGDFDGDGTTDIAVWRPSTGYWYVVQSSNGAIVTRQWGAPTDVPVVGDFDGDGKTDIAVWRPSTGYWYIIQSSNDQVIAKRWGAPTDMPVVGDYDGDGKADIAVWRPSNGYWYIIQSSDDQVIAKQWGASTDMPVVGDYDGDGKADIAVWRPSTGYWYIIQSSDDQVIAKQWGAPTDMPVVGDYDGDGKADIAVWRASTGYWYIIQSTENELSKQWGETGDIPVQGRYGGGTPTEIAVWRPSDGTWYIVSSAAIQEWTFESGAMTDPTLGTDPPGVYGTLGVAAAGNVPGGRGGAMTWTDGTNLWLFGGAQETNQQLFGDLWKYHIASGLWTWVGGSQNFGSSGVYGQLGSAAASNIPGARFGAVTWTDSAGTFWMFGGQGFDSTGTLVWLNDLWKYAPTTNLWTWVSGSNVGNQPGVYGTLGVAASANVPGARLSAASWTDKAGNLYLFGGAGLDSTATQNAMNDLWVYSPGSGQWTWVSGSNIGGAYGSYGTQGRAAVANVPGGRQYASTWIDASGNLWLFGGDGFAASSSTTGELSDLWKFTPGNGQWTWMNGSQGVNQLGIYGALGTASASNAPGARYQAATWTDSAGKLRMFGGYGYSSSAGYSNYPPFAINISDFWLYDPSVNEWTWTGGASDYAEPGICGTQGVASLSNIPGARYGAGYWKDHTGALWLFGGTGANCEINGSFDEGVQMNDLWRFGY